MIQNGKLHRDNDLPAVIRTNGDQEWYQNDQLHRDNDLPAIIQNGDQLWYKHGVIHRDNDLPAFVWANGYQGWYQDGLLHRENGLPAIIYMNGTKKRWYYLGYNYWDNSYSLFCNIIQWISFYPFIFNYLE